MTRSGQWTKEEDDLVAAMMDEGLTRQEMADRLPGRTMHAVKCRLIYKKTPWAEMAERNKRARLLRPKKPRLTAKHRVASETLNVVVPQSVLDERNRRYMASRSITAILMGDPEPGRARL